ncbi:MAG: endonuclease G [Saprospiraceae bacterium]
MAKFRKNHSNQEVNDSVNQRGSTPSKMNTFRLVIGLVFIIIILYALSQVKIDSWETDQSQPSTGQDITISNEKIDDAKKSYYPESTTGEVVEHKYYTLSYSEEHEQAEWVAYKLTEDNLRKPRIKRAKKFTPDKSIKGSSAYHNDYTHSGYTRGHLAPAGDMAFSEDAMRESFYMSNMSPQLKEFNGGIWRELEETVRDWAYDNDELYIVSGPILNDDHIIKQIGRNNKVSVPDLFYKIVLDIKGEDKKAIAFLLPNERSEKRLQEYIVSIDELEELLDINFFADFLDPALEEELERSRTVKGWRFDNKKYNTRINKWNNY